MSVIKTHRRRLADMSMFHVGDGVGSPVLPPGILSRSAAFASAGTLSIYNQSRRSSACAHDMKYWPSILMIVFEIMADAHLRPAVS